MKAVSLPSTSPLFRELTLIVVLKIVLLVALRLAFFADPPVPKGDAEAVSRGLLARVPASTRFAQDMPAQGARP